MYNNTGRLTYNQKNTNNSQSIKSNYLADRSKLHMLRIYSLLICMFLQQSCPAQSFWEIPDTFQSNRFWTAAGIGTVLYGAAVIGLNEAWYKDYPRSNFQFFDDWNEWKNIDKLGHIYTGYFESYLSYKAARWTGLSERKAAWTGFGVGILLQSTIEVLDAFSSQWGFSVYDFGANVIGSGSFLAQQLIWSEQKFKWKVSSNLASYSNTMIQSTSGETTTSLRLRADELFGTSKAERFLKDYNAQTIWLSSNLHALGLVSSPKWLNLAIGVGAENMFGGFNNEWSIDGQNFVLDSKNYDRSTQLFLAPDLDLSKIQTGSKLFNSLLDILNIFKFPAPSLEWHSGNGIKVHWLYF